MDCLISRWLVDQFNSSFVYFYIDTYFVQMIFICYRQLLFMVSDKKRVLHGVSS